MIRSDTSLNISSIRSNLLSILDFLPLFEAKKWFITAPIRTDTPPTAELKTTALIWYSLQEGRSGGSLASGYLGRVPGRNSLGG